jgi:ABC-type antimicrobial peptide transport system permease subunit
MMGVFAVSAFTVTMRVREIGIRVALGASRREVVGLVLRDGLSPVLAGIATGTAVALASAPALSGMLFAVSPRDGASVLITAATIGAAALLANVVPARRAANVDPIVALRLDG